MKAIDISVIIPVYNVEPYVEACLRSVLSQEHPDLALECIIVDDCGSDKSMDIVHNVLADYSGNIIFNIISHDTNRGLSAARNTAINAAQGQYLFFLDSDDRLLPGALQGLFKLTTEHIDVDIIQGEIQLDKPTKGMEPCLGISSVSLPEYISDKKTARHTILFDMPVIACGKLISRKFIISNNLFFKDGMIHEDDMWDVCASQFINSIAFYFTPVYYYNNNIPNSITGNKDKTSSFIGRMLIIQQAVERFIQTPCRTYYDYILLNLELYTRIEQWDLINDKKGAKKAMNCMRGAVDKAKCRPLQVAAKYYSLPLAISNSRFIAPFYRRFFGIYKKNYARKLQQD